MVIPRVNVQGEERREVWLLDSAILVRSNTTLELDNCRIKLSDRCRDNLIRSANCGLGITDIRPLQNIHIRGIGTVVLEGADHPRATGDSGKTLGQRTYGTDAGKDGESQTGDWRNIGILLAFVENFSIQNRRDQGLALLGHLAGTLCPRHAAGSRFRLHSSPHDRRRPADDPESGRN